MTVQSVKTRRDAIKEVLETLENGRRVSEKVIESVLTTQEKRNLDSKITELKIRRALVSSPQFKRFKGRFSTYLKLLKIADMLDGRRAATPRNRMPRKKWDFRSPPHFGCLSSKQLLERAKDAAYENALDELQTVLEWQPGLGDLLEWRPVFDGDQCNVSPTPSGVPRLINTRSQHSRFGNESIRSLQIEALRESLDNNYSNSQLYRYGDLSDPAPNPIAQPRNPFSTPKAPLSIENEEW